MYEITVEGRFSAAHRHRLPAGERPLHGHDFRVAAVLGGETLVDDVLVDFHEVEVTLRAQLEELSHRDLSLHPDFAASEPTPARLARWIHDRLVKRLVLPPGVAVAAVEVEDTPGTGAIYRPDVASSKRA